ENGDMDGRVRVPLRLEPFQGVYVVFRPATDRASAIGSSEEDGFPYVPPRTLHEITGNWSVRFTYPQNSKPAFETTFSGLTDWTQSPDERVKYFSGTATFRISFDGTAAIGAMESSGGRVWLNLGSLREIGSVRLNGCASMVVWEYPFRVDVTEYLRSGENQLEVDVTNFWPNAMVGEAKRSPEERIYRTNVIRFRDDTFLKPSGLFGPVTLEIAPGPL
ncbi:MAG: hypothetical protein Q4C47_04860, partial [Planctomycetia bacterium]|nr:hypothetical protein [Planctomycetia bacterium]